MRGESVRNDRRSRLQRARWTRVQPAAVLAGVFTVMLTASATGATLHPAASARPELFGWGSNGVGELGDGFVNGPDFCESFGCAGTPSPVAFSHRRNIAAVALGSSYGLALTRDGGVLTWGANYAGQLGNGTTDSSDVPEDVCAPGVMVPCQRHLGAVTGVSAGYELSLAVQRSGRVLAWGANEWGQLGDGGTTSSDVPTYVSGVSGVKEVSAGGQHALALLRDGTVVAWAGTPKERWETATWSGKSHTATSPCPWLG